MQNLNLSRNKYAIESGIKDDVELQWGKNNYELEFLVDTGNIQQAWISKHILKTSNSKLVLIKILYCQR